MERASKKEAGGEEKLIFFLFGLMCHHIRNIPCGVPQSSGLDPIPVFHVHFTSHRHRQ